MNNSVLLFKIVFDFLNGLSDSQIEELINEKTHLKIEVNRSKSNPKTILDESSISSICAELEEKTTREAARSYLTGININKAALRLLVKHYNIPLISKATNSQMVDAIIEAVVGSKIRYEALYSTKLTE